jgi:hypothetical protein
MHNKLKNILGGLFLSFFIFFMGYDTYSKNALNVYYGYYVNLGILHIPLIIVFIVGAFYLLYLTYKEFLSNKNKIKQIEFSICPKCKESFNYNDLKNGKCLYCENIDTLDIEEYYKENKINEDKDEK